MAPGSLFLLRTFSFHSPPLLVSARTCNLLCPLVVLELYWVFALIFLTSRLFGVCEVGRLIPRIYKTLCHSFRLHDTRYSGPWDVSVSYNFVIEAWFQHHLAEFRNERCVMRTVNAILK
jgi:hypothetical protein